MCLGHADIKPGNRGNRGDAAARLVPHDPRGLVSAGRRLVAVFR